MAINFPIKKKVEHKAANKANLGMELEDMINQSNEYYLVNNKAVIHKKPTPIQIVKVDYPNRNMAKIVEAYYKTPSTTDYNGIYKGKYIDFEAKETNNKTSFPLSNIHEHQIRHLKSIIKHGGIGFIIVRFNAYNETYLLMMNDFISYTNNNDRKSIPYDYFKEKGHLIKIKYAPRLDYLNILEEYGGLYEETKY